MLGSRFTYLNTFVTFLTELVGNKRMRSEWDEGVTYGYKLALEHLEALLEILKKDPEKAVEELEERLFQK